MASKAPADHDSKPADASVNSATTPEAGRRTGRKDVLPPQFWVRTREIWESTPKCSPAKAAAQASAELGIEKVPHHSSVAERLKKEGWQKGAAPRADSTDHKADTNPEPADPQGDPQPAAAGPDPFKELIAKQALFVDEYLLDLNGTQAYMRAFKTTNANSAAVEASRLLGKLRRASDEKGSYQLDIDQVSGAELVDCVVIASPRRMSELAQIEQVAVWLLDQFLGRCWLGVELLSLLNDESWLYRLRGASEMTAIPLVITGDVHMHVRSRKALQDVVTATRVGIPAVRLGLRMIAGLKEATAERIVATRAKGVFDSAEDLARRARLEQGEMTLLAAADALLSLSGHRRQQVWDASALRATPVLLRDAPVEEDLIELPHAPEGEEIVFDYAATGLTLRRYPMACYGRCSTRSACAPGRAARVPGWLATAAW